MSLVVRHWRLRLWQWLAWQLCIPHGGVMNKRGHDHRSLHQVAFERVIVDIHVCVVCARTVVDLILDELKARQSDRVKRKMVCPPGIPDGQSRGA